MSLANEIKDSIEFMMDPGAGVNVDPSKISPPFTPAFDASFASPAASIPPEYKPEIVAPESEFEEHKDPKGKTIWVATPTFEDQYKRFPQSTRLVGPVVAVFDAASTEQLRELNNLLSKQQPEFAPSILIASRKENFHEGKWLMLLEYFRVEYKQLITTS
jgi:hypothetical protein